MPKTAHAEPGTTIGIGNNIYNFDDGTRQVTEAEAEELRRYVDNGGAKIEITETKTKGKG